MKKLLLPVLATILFSCSKDENNCESEKQAIRDKYQTQIQYVIDHPFAGVIDYRKITILEQERDSRIENACK